MAKPERWPMRRALVKRARGWSRRSVETRAADKGSPGIDGISQSTCARLLAGTYQPYEGRRYRRVGEGSKIFPLVALADRDLPRPGTTNGRDIRVAPGAREADREQWPAP